MGITQGNYDNQISQKGLGHYTLCESCNPNTGSWYGTAFIEWAQQSMNILEYTENQPSLYYRFRIFPLRVIKQIACMMFSVNDNEFRLFHQDLVKFVLDKRECHLNPDIKFFAFFNSKRFRVTGGMVKVKTDNFDMNNLVSIEEELKGIRAKIESQHTFSELAFPPLGYVLTFEAEPPDPRLIDISFFAKYHYDDFTTLNLRLPVLPVNSPYPADYRSPEDIDSDKSHLTKVLHENRDTKSRHLGWQFMK